MRKVADPEVPAFVTKLQRVSTYAEIEEIMKSSDFVMAGAAERTLFLEDTLIMSEGQRHSELKQMFAPLMSRQAMAYYELRLVGPVIEETLAEMRTERGSDGLVRTDVVPLVHEALTRIAARVTGVDGVDTPERTGRFRDLVLTLSTATTGSFSTVPVEQLVQAGEDAMRELIDDFLQSSIDRRVALVAAFRAGQIAKDDLPRDVLTSLCLADDLSRPDDDSRIAYVWRQCVLFLTASIKTTSHALPHVFVHLAEWVEEHPEDSAKLIDPDFLHKAVAESFRLHQATPARFRAAVRGVTLSSGRTVEAGEMVALLASPANKETGVFGSDAEYFNPWRETPEGLSPWGMTFGIGVHACLGRNLVTGIMNRDDDKYGAQGTAVRILRALYELGATLDPDDPPRRPEASMHDAFEAVPIILRTR